MCPLYIKGIEHAHQLNKSPTRVWIPSHSATQMSFGTQLLSQSGKLNRGHPQEMWGFESQDYRRPPLH